MPEDAKELGKWLGELRGSKVDLRVAQRGDKAALAETALTNAKHALMLYKTRRSADFTARADALAGIQRALNLDEAPLRIECFDVSHLGGTGVVASMVVFEDGLPKKDHYRRFSIEETTDDTDSIYQVLMRRLKHLSDPEVAEDGNGKAIKRFAYRPNLLIVDGGQPQVNAAARALADSNVTDLAVVGIAKRLEEILNEYALDGIFQTGPGGRFPTLRRDQLGSREQQVEFGDDRTRDVIGIVVWIWNE